MCKRINSPERLGVPLAILKAGTEQKAVSCLHVGMWVYEVSLGRSWGQCEKMKRLRCTTFSCGVPFSYDARGCEFKLVPWIADVVDGKSSYGLPAQIRDTAIVYSCFVENVKLFMAVVCHFNNLDEGKNLSLMEPGLIT